MREYIDLTDDEIQYCIQILQRKLDLWVAAVSPEPARADRERWHDELLALLEEQKSRHPPTFSEMTDQEFELYAGKLTTGWKQTKDVLDEELKRRAVIKAAKALELDASRLVEQFEMAVRGTHVNRYNYTRTALMNRLIGGEECDASKD